MGPRNSDAQVIKQFRRIHYIITLCKDLKLRFKYRQSTNIYHINEYCYTKIQCYFVLQSPTGNGVEGPSDTLPSNTVSNETLGLTSLRRPQSMELPSVISNSHEGL